MSTPGKQLVAALTKQLGPSMEWDEAELVVLGMVEAARDRLEVLRTHFAAKSLDPDTSAAGLAVLAAECRLSETAIAKWGASLNPTGGVAPKSRQHQAAAMTRWHPNRGA
jgi:hypothetical protein